MWSEGEQPARESESTGEMPATDDSAPVTPENPFSRPALETQYGTPVRKTQFTTPELEALMGTESAAEDEPLKDQPPDTPEDEPVNPFTIPETEDIEIIAPSPPIQTEDHG
jgi:hypothetical protein